MKSIKKKLNFIYTKIVLWLSKSYTIYVLISAIVFSFLLIAAFSNKLDIADIIELSAFSAVLLEHTLFALSNALCKNLLNKVEDPSKLITDYEHLANIYKSSASSMIKDNDNKNIPIILEAWLYDKSITINDNIDNEYKLPEMVIKNYDKLFSAHQTSNIYNNINIRVNDWQQTGSSYTIHTGRTTYYNSLVTNRSMDYEIDNGISVRQLYECGPFVQPLSLSKLSNHLGFNGFVESNDGFFAFIFHQGNVSIGKRTWGNSIGASLKTKYALNNLVFNQKGLEKGIISEVKDELTIEPDEIIPVDELRTESGKIMPVNKQFKQIIVVSSYRDLVEGGKPQLFVYCKSKLSKDEITEKFKETNRGVNRRIRRTSDTRERNEIEMETDGNKIMWISKQDIIGNIKIYADRIEYNGKTFHMMPSASACVAMLKEFLNAVN
ncbi:MAG: hypothetical protein NC244_13025 [Alistipes senegalensis]|nr:hypothetical protein [Alistipes senegalensis]